ncbi:hypothetical protein FRC09_015827 [Ceratobasidium sp. 395]|nr:hypothetical protein FRC09_015827 [Ceratobasidium sp. 395]
MRSRMGSIVGMGSESSIAEDEDEDEEDEDQTGSWKGTPSVAGGSEVWWSGPSSRGDSCRSSRRGSFTSSAAAEDEELEEVTVSMPVQDVAVRDSVASTARVNRDSVTASEASDRLSQGSVDVSSDAFLQKLDELDASVPTTPPPSDRSSSEVSSSEPSVELLEMPIGVGPRHPPSGAGGMNGGGASAGGYPGDGWKSGSAAQGGFGGNAPRRPAAESTESSSESESDEPFARRGRDARGPTKPSARSQSMPRQPAPLAKAANRQTAPAKDTSDESDDDVPLAQRIPTALKAQKSIRVQDKAEREERRQKRMERMRRRAADKAAPTGGEGGVAAGDLAQRLLSDIVESAKQRGELEAPGAGGWHLWEQSNECGMERPVRDFEFVSDVLKAWNAEKRVNVLIIRRSQLCGLLKPENIPTSSPIMSGWVMWASKPGKWSKRWLELKEHSLYVSKSDKPGKEQTFLCGVSNFDAYVVTHIQRAPKGFVFATKSTEGSGVFEKEEDSSHIFSCDREIGEVWLNKILLARSYVLQQERSILPRPSNAGSLAHSKSLLSRSGTKKSTVSSRSAASQNQQPLVQDLYSSPFSGGSLLAKAAANGA